MSPAGRPPPSRPRSSCSPFSLANSATVVAESPGRPDVGDSDTHHTPLTCPPGPPVPPQSPVPPVPGPSGAVPEVPGVPDAGTAGEVALSPPRRCLRRGSRVTIRGARMAGVRITVRGRHVAGLQIRALQRRAVLRLRRNFVPGRYRVPAHIRLQRGAATTPLRLTRTVRICAPRRSQSQPRFTG